MADIVERLRNAVGGPVYDELREAADEIERLKETYPYSELDMDMHVEAVTKDLKAEIERLRAALTEIKNLLGRPADPSERSVLRYAAFKTADVALADNIQHSTGKSEG
jgi:hypothetical protein